VSLFAETHHIRKLLKKKRLGVTADVAQVEGFERRLWTVLYHKSKSKKRKS